MNHVDLTASIVEVSPLRYTPAGLPAANFVLDHESEVEEAGSNRQVKLSIKAVAFGTMAEQTSQLPLGKVFRFRGFLISARTNKSVIFHIQELNPI